MGRNITLARRSAKLNGVHPNESKWNDGDGGCAAFYFDLP
jgi:hypothetical protein